MPRIKKTKLSKLPDYPGKTEEGILEKNFNRRKPKRDPMTKFGFAMAILYGTTATLVFTLAFTAYAAIIFFNQVNNIMVAMAPYQINSDFFKKVTYEKVTYENDKNFYKPDETVVLNIINDSEESIYLAPCQYFNKFEKKIPNNWKSISLADCLKISDLSYDSIEKVSKKAEERILASQLGEGVWRGVSTIYFGCKEARTESCTKNQTIYTGEFRIAASALTASSGMEKINPIPQPASAATNETFRTQDKKLEPASY